MAALAALGVALAALAVALTRDDSAFPDQDDIRFVSQYSDNDSTVAKEVTLYCPEGTRLLYGGGSSGYPGRMPTVAVTRSIPLHDENGDGWIVAAREIAPERRDWWIFGIAVCAPG